MCIHMYIYVFTQTIKFTHAHPHTHNHTQTHKYKHTNTQTPWQIHKHTNIQTRTHTHTHIHNQNAHIAFFFKLHAHIRTPIAKMRTLISRRNGRILKKDGATCVGPREPKKRSQAAERLSHLPCPLHQVCPSAAATAPCSSLQPRFRPSALVKRQQAARSSMHALERRTRPRLPRAFGLALLLGTCKFTRAMERRMQSRSPLSKRTSVALGTLRIG